MARGLTVELVVAAAIEIADEAGLGAVTMAAVAKRCGFTTMSLYRHVASKDELVRRMLDATLGTAPALRVAGLARRPGAVVARRCSRVLDRHPWGIDVPITGMLGTHAQLSWLDRGLEALAGTGLDDGEKAEIVLLLNGYVFWAARLRFQVPQEAIDVDPAVDSTCRAVPGAGARGRRRDLRGRLDAARTTSPSASSACWTASRP